MLTKDLSPTSESSDSYVTRSHFELVEDERGVRPGRSREGKRAHYGPKTEIDTKKILWRFHCDFWLMGAIKNPENQI